MVSKFLWLCNSVTVGTGFPWDEFVGVKHGAALMSQGWPLSSVLWDPVVVQPWFCCWSCVCACSPTCLCLDTSHSPLLCSYCGHMKVWLFSQSSLPPHQVTSDCSHSQDSSLLVYRTVAADKSGNEGGPRQGNGEQDPWDPSIPLFCSLV